MVVLELCLLPVLSFQEPVPAQPATTTPAQETPVASADPKPTIDATDPARWLPASTLFAVTFRLGNDTDLSGLRARLRDLDPMGTMDQAVTEMESHLGQHGVAMDDVMELLRGGVAIGVTELGPKPQFVCVADLSQCEDPIRMKAQEFLANNTAADSHGGIRGDRMIVASSAELLDATAQIADSQSADSGSQSLAATDGYRSACDRAPLAGSAAMTVFVQPNALVAQLMAMVPEAQRAAAERVTNALQIEAMDHVVFRAQVDARDLHFAASCALPEGDSLLGAFFGNPQMLSESLAGYVPKSATEFTFAATDISAVVRSSLELLKTAEPGMGVMADMMVQQIGEKAEIDIMDVVVDGFSGRSIGLRVPAGTATMIGLEDGKEFAGAIAKLVAAAELPVETTTANDVTVYQFPEGQLPVPISFATLGNWFCITEGDATLAAIAKQIDHPTKNEAAFSALRDRPAGATMVLGATEWSTSMTSRRTANGVVWQGTIGLVPGGGDIDLTMDSPAPPEQVMALEQAENDAESTTVPQLLRLAKAEHAGVAARATWLLRRRESPEARKALGDLATDSKHAEVRVQAFHALLRLGNAQSVPVALAGIDDESVEVRTLAAQLLGKLRRPEAKGALLALVSERAKIAGPGESTTDLQAALLALTDLEAADELLPVATVLDGSRAEGFGEALTFYFQTLSPQLEPNDETPVMVAVLSHSEPVLRRYAIGRLSELRDLTTVRALEARLASEGPELQPLVELALAQIRRQKHGEAEASESFVAQTKARWNALTAQQRLIASAVGGVVGLGVLICLVVIVRRGSSRRRGRRSASDLVAPSEEYLDDLEAESDELADEAEGIYDEAESYGEGDDDEEWQDGEYEDDGEVDEIYGDDSYDESEELEEQDARYH